MMKRAAVALMLAVLTAGCIGGGGAKKLENDGIRITKFSADPTEVNDFQPVDFLLEIENVGSVTATNVGAKLEGVDSWSGAQKGQTLCEGNLKPPSPADGTPGGLKFCNWNLNPPDLSEGASATFSIDARVTYQYRSSRAIVLKAINIDQQRILRKRGETVANAMSVTQDDASPIKASIKNGPIPLVVDTEDPAPAEFTYRLELQNVGGGWPITDGQLGRIAGLVQMRGGGASSASCTGLPATLRSDGTAPVVCTFTVDKAQWTGAGPKEDSILFTIDLNYGYFVKKTTSVLVRGTSRGPGTPGGGGGTPGGRGGGCNGPPGQPGSVIYACTGARSSCDENAGEGIKFTCTNGNWGPEQSTCHQQCDVDDTVPSCTNGEKHYRCTGTGCANNGGEGVPYLCSSGTWTAQGSECTSLCHGIGGTWGRA